MAVDDLCRHLSQIYSERYGLHKDLFVFTYDRDREISVYTPNMSFFVPDNHVMDYLSEKWNIYVNVLSDLRGGSVKRFYLINWLEKDVLYSTDLEGPFDTYDQATIRAFLDCFSVVNRKLKQGAKKR